MDNYLEIKKEKLKVKTEGILLSDLPLSTRLYNCLRRNGYETLSDIMLEESEKFDMMRNFGSQSKEELDALRNYVFSSERIDILKLCSNNENVILSDKSEDTLGKVVDVAKHRKPSEGDYYVFIDDAGEKTDDLKIREIGFSNRTTNVFLRNKIGSLREVAEMKYSELCALEGLGKNSIEEVLIYLREKTLYSIAENNDLSDIVESVDKIVDYYKQFFGNEIVENNIQGIRNIVIRKNMFQENSEANNILDVYSYAVENPICLLFKAKIINLINKQHFDGISLNSIYREIIPNHPELKSAIDQIVERMICDKLIRCIDGNLSVYRLFLREWLDTLSEQDKEVFSYKCEGKTLEEIGALYGVTRERIRQIISRITRKKPKLYEDEFSSIFEKYYFTDKQYCIILNVDVFQINYLKLMYKRGSNSLETLIEDRDIPHSIQGRAKEAIKDSFVIIDDEIVPIKREFILRKLLCLYCSDKDCTTEEFEKIYYDYLIENDLNEREQLLFPTSRAFEARIIEYPYTLSKFGKRIRFYDTTKVDINVFLKNINLENYYGMEISTLKIYRDYPELMDTYDIRDEYELHNLLRKKSTEISSKMFDITRMPFVNFGGNRNKQVEELLYRTAPISNEELAVLYEDLYGVRKETVLANFFDSINLYLTDGIFDLTQVEMSSNDYESMKVNLSEDFYLWSEIENIYKKIAVDYNPEAINPLMMKKLGYKVYSQCLIKSDYTSVESYFLHVFSQKQCFSLSEFSNEYKMIPSYYTTLSSLRDSLEVVEIDKDKYVHFEYLKEQYGIHSKEELLAFGKTITENNSEAFFSIDKLVISMPEYNQWGIKNTVSFLNSVIRVQENIKTGKIVNAYVASAQKLEVSFLSIITHFIDVYGEISVNNVRERLKDELGIQVDHCRIVYLVENSDNLTIDGIFDFVVRKNSIKQEISDCYLLNSRYSEMIRTKISNIQSSKAEVVNVYWKEKYISFLNYCFERDFYKMEDILKINFAEIYYSNNDYGISKSLIPEIINIFVEWVNNLSQKEEEPEILDLFFKN